MYLLNDDGLQRDKASEQQYLDYLEFSEFVLLALRSNTTSLSSANIDKVLSAVLRLNQPNLDKTLMEILTCYKMQLNSEQSKTADLITRRHNVGQKFLEQLSQTIDTLISGKISFLRLPDFKGEIEHFLPYIRMSDEIRSSLLQKLNQLLGKNNLPEDTVTVLTALKTQSVKIVILIDLLSLQCYLKHYLFIINI